MNIPLVLAGASSVISSVALGANLAGKLPSMENQKRTVILVALGSIALTAALYKGVTFTSAKGFASDAVSFISSNRLKSAGAAAAAVATAVAAHFAFFRTSEAESVPPPTPGEGAPEAQQ